MTVRTSFRLAGATGLAAGLTLGGSVFMAATTASAAPAVHVTICHATGSPDNGGNGFVVIGPAATGVVSGHAAWDFKNHVVGTNGHLADIIPPFTYVDSAGDDHAFPGQHWDDEGQAIYDGGTCAGTYTPPTSTSTTTSTTTPPTSTSTTSTSTTTPPTSTTSTTSTSTTTPPTSTSTTSTSTTTPPTSTSTTTPPTSTSTTGTTSTNPPVATPNPGGPQTPGVVQTDGVAAGSSDLLAALGVAALLGAGGAVLTVRLRSAGRRH